MPAFGDRLAQVFATRGHLCVGIDPHRSLLADWDLPDSAEGVREFGLRAIDAAHGACGIIKPQVAFFERFGSAGYAALERVLEEGRRAGLMIIADVKRGDIGSSFDAYSQAWLGEGSPLEADAMTVSAYQGVGSLAGAMSLARDRGKGMFVLAATSNPEASVVQNAQIHIPNAQVQEESPAPMSVARAIIDDVDTFNRVVSTDSGVGSVGVVLGATTDLAAFGIDTARDERLAGIPVLAPGFGHQGARVASVRQIYGLMTPGVIVTESRSLLGAGPTRLAETIRRHASEVAEAIG